jgi:hypothetical protein
MVGGYTCDIFVAPRLPAETRSSRSRHRPRGPFMRAPPPSSLPSLLGRPPRVLHVDDRDERATRLGNTVECDRPAVRRISQPAPCSCQARPLRTRTAPSFATSGYGGIPPTTAGTARRPRTASARCAGGWGSTSAPSARWRARAAWTSRDQPTALPGVQNRPGGPGTGPVRLREEDVVILF